jgi:hypothetical protein
VTADAVRWEAAITTAQEYALMDLSFISLVLHRSFIHDDTIDHEFASTSTELVLRFLSLRPVSVYVHETSQFSIMCAERTREPDGWMRVI